MNISFNNYKKIVDLFQENEILGVTQISNQIGISRTIVHKNIKKLLEENKIEKTGKGAHTKYKSLIFKGEKVKDIPNIIVDFKTKKIFDEIFYKFDSDGKLLKGFEGFKIWVFDRNFNLEKSIENYKKIYKYVESKQDECGLLDATNIFNKKFEKNYMKKVYYADEYAFMEYGRSKLAEMTFFAKQSQDKELINQSIEEFFYKLECFLFKNKDVDAIAITPWSIDRNNQLLGILKNRLEKIGLPFVNLEKFYKGSIPIPQKTIKSKSGRLKNAKNTIFVYDDNIKNYKKVLLIDDFVGSGATLNITAQKIIESGVKEVVGFSIVGSMDLSYEVINEI